MQTSAPRQIDCFTIALGKKTGTTFPITFNNNQKYNALYDTGAGASLINYSAYVSLGKDLNTGYQPYIKNASGEDMGALGQVTCSYTINSKAIHAIIYCLQTHDMTNHIGNGLHIHKFHGHRLDP